MLGNAATEKVEPEDDSIDFSLDDDKENPANESDAESAREKSSNSNHDCEGETGGQDNDVDDDVDNDVDDDDDVDVDVDDDDDVDDDVYDDVDDDQKIISQPTKAKRPSDVKEGKTLFIRNLSFESSEESLYELFKKYGAIEYCRVLEDKRTGRSRGMAFVKFKTVESTERCFAEASKEGSGNTRFHFFYNKHD